MGGAPGWEPKASLLPVSQHHWLMATVTVPYPGVPATSWGSCLKEALGFDRGFGGVVVVSYRVVATQLSCCRESDCPAAVSEWRPCSLCAASSQHLRVAGHCSRPVPGRCQIPLIWLSYLAQASSEHLCSVGLLLSQPFLLPSPPPRGQTSPTVNLPASPGSLLISSLRCSPNKSFGVCFSEDWT